MARDEYSVCSGAHCYCLKLFHSDFELLITCSPTRHVNMDGIINEPLHSRLLFLMKGHLVSAAFGERL
jgi:hypothetical protein